MCIIFPFVSVVILFVYDSDRYGTGATSEEEFFHDNFLRIPVVAFWEIGEKLSRICLEFVPNPPLPLYFFNVNNIIICLEVYFS